MTIAVPSASTSAAQRFDLDREHGGLRFVALLIFVVGFIIGFVISSALIVDAGFDLLSALIGLVTAFALTWVSEKFLRRVWKSGRVVEIGPDGVVLSKRGVTEMEVRTEDPAVAILWTFKITKRSRLPKGHSMLACAIERDEKHLTIYTFMSPAQFEAFEDASRFKPIASRKDEKRSPQRDDLRQAGEQRRLREAEEYRWLNGAEMTPEDFIVYFRELERLHSEWMPLR